MRAETFQYIFFFLFLSKFIFKFYLNRRNKNYIYQHKDAVPREFQDKIRIEEHQKAASYSIEKIQFSQFSLILSFFMLVIWLPLGGLNALIRFSSSFTGNPITHTLILFFLFSIIESLIQIPLSLYSTFVIEEKYGFNKMTLKLFIMDLLKSSIISLILITPILYLVTYLFLNYNYWWIVSWLVIMVFQFLVMWAYPKFIAPLFNKFTPLEQDDLKIKIFELLKKTNLVFKDIFVMNASLRSSHGNAYFTGFGKNKRIVFFDTLLKNLTTNEVLAILAHELGHFKFKHIQKSLIKSSFFLLVGLYLINQLVHMESFWRGHFVDPHHMGVSLLLFSLIIPMYVFWLTPLFSYLSRKNEFEADQFAVTHTQGIDLETSLVKLYQENASTLTPDPLYSQFYFSHPPALERIKFIRSLSK